MPARKKFRIRDLPEDLRRGICEHGRVIVVGETRHIKAAGTMGVAPGRIGPGGL